VEGKIKNLGTGHPFRFWGQNGMPCADLGREVAYNENVCQIYPLSKTRYINKKKQKGDRDGMQVLLSK
jgi:hypothetical protein